MKHFIDGNQLCIINDDFVDLQESPAVFYPLVSETAQTVLADGIRELPVGDLMSIHNNLKQQRNEQTHTGFDRTASGAAGTTPAAPPAPPFR